MRPISWAENTSRPGEGLSCEPSAGNAGEQGDEGTRTEEQDSGCSLQHVPHQLHCQPGLRKDSPQITRRIKPPSVVCLVRHTECRGNQHLLSYLADTTIQPLTPMRCRLLHLSLRECCFQGPLLHSEFWGLDHKCDSNRDGAKKGKSHSSPATAKYTAFSQLSAFLPVWRVFQWFTHFLQPTNQAWFCLSPLWAHLPKVLFLLLPGNPGNHYLVLPSVQPPYHHPSCSISSPTEEASLQLLNTLSQEPTQVRNRELPSSSMWAEAGPQICFFSTSNVLRKHLNLSILRYDLTFPSFPQTHDYFPRPAMPQITQR